MVEDREIGEGQDRNLDPRPAGTDRHRLELVAKHHCLEGYVLAVVDRSNNRGDGLGGKCEAGEVGADLGLKGRGDLDIEVCRAQADAFGVAFHRDVGEVRDRVLAADRILHG